MAEPATSVDALSHVITGGSSGIGGGLLTFLGMKLLGKSNGPVESPAVEVKIDKVIDALHQTNVLLAEIKGSLSK